MRLLLPPIILFSLAFHFSSSKNINYKRILIKCHKSAVVEDKWLTNYLMSRTAIECAVFCGMEHDLCKSFSFHNSGPHRGECLLYLQEISCKPTNYTDIDVYTMKSQMVSSNSNQKSKPETFDVVAVASLDDSLLVFGPRGMATIKVGLMGYTVLKVWPPQWSILFEDLEQCPRAAFTLKSGNGETLFLIEGNDVKMYNITTETFSDTRQKLDACFSLQDFFIGEERNPRDLKFNGLIGNGDIKVIETSDNEKLCFWTSENGLPPFSKMNCGSSPYRNWFPRGKDSRFNAIARQSDNDIVLFRNSTIFFMQLGRIVGEFVLEI